MLKQTAIAYEDNVSVVNIQHNRLQEDYFSKKAGRCISLIKTQLLVNQMLNSRIEKLIILAVKGKIMEDRNLRKSVTIYVRLCHYF